MFNIITPHISAQAGSSSSEQKWTFIIITSCNSNMLHTQVNTFGDQPVDYKCQQAYFSLSVLKKIICILCALVFA